MKAANSLAKRYGTDYTVGAIPDVICKYIFPDPQNKNYTVLTCLHNINAKRTETRYCKGILIHRKQKFKFVFKYLCIMHTFIR